MKITVGFLLPAYLLLHPLSMPFSVPKRRSARGSRTVMVLIEIV